jgi:N-acetylmuramoyl-L-alanine amidase
VPARVVVIDPGHGGVDPGAISTSGAREKDVTLAMARRVRTELQAIGGYRVVLTRDRDEFIRLRHRVQKARKAGASVFLSLHADILNDPSTRGLSVYTLSEKASDAEASALADRENKADLIAGVNLARQAPDVASILFDLAQRETMNRSVRLAIQLVQGLQKETLLLPRSHRFAGFAVLKAPDVPSVLIELGYLSNPVENTLLQDPRYRARLARSIARGVDAYFGRYDNQASLR